MVKMDAEPFQKRHRKTNTIYTGKQNQSCKIKPLYHQRNQLLPKTLHGIPFELFNKDTIAKDFDIIKKANQHYKSIYS
jgi:hypothetical protein